MSPIEHGDWNVTSSIVLYLYELRFAIVYNGISQFVREGFEICRKFDAPNTQKQNEWLKRLYNDRNFCHRYIQRADLYFHNVKHFKFLL